MSRFLSETCSYINKTHYKKLTNDIVVTICTDFIWVDLNQYFFKMKNHLNLIPMFKMYCFNFQCNLKILN